MKASRNFIYRVLQKENLIILPSAKQSLRNFIKDILPFIFIFVVLTLGIILRFSNNTNMNSRSPDEIVCTAQANTLAENGAEGIKFLVENYNNYEKLWVYPNPLRVGYLWAFVAAIKMTGISDIGRQLSCFFSIISLLLLTILGLRFFNKWIALYSVLFMSVSPVALAISRRTWQDAMLGCFGPLLIYICCEITRSAHRIILYLLFIILGSYCILIKDSGVLIYFLCVAWISWTLFIKEKSILKSAVLIVVSIVGAVISIAYLIHVAGGIANVVEVMKHFKEAVATNSYALNYQSGPWYHFLAGVWLISPLNTVLYVVGITGTLSMSMKYIKSTNLLINKSQDVILGIMFFMIIFMTSVTAVPYCKNYRYISVLFGPFYLVGGLGLWYIVLYAKNKLNNVCFYGVIIVIVAIVLVGAGNDYRNFEKVFIELGAKDIVLKSWEKALH